MPKIESLARQAIEISETQPFRNQEDFVSFMKKNDFPFTGWSFQGMGMTAHFILFQDGSGFFADREDGAYKLWPHDEEDEDERQDEFLLTMKSPNEVIEAGAELYAISEFDEDFCEALTAHIKECVSEHPNPPEAMRSVILEPEHEFEWVDRDRAREVQEMIVICALILHPEAQEVVIKGDTRPGLSHPEKRSNQNMFSSMQSGSFMDECQENMAAYYAGEPHAEISESSQEDYKAIQAANEPLAWLSRRLLKAHGKPMGWSVDYNDGHRTRMSGYSAYSDSTVVEVDGLLSNHQMVQKEASLAHYLQREELYDDFQDLLETHGCKRLPALAA
jgi:hypothetical protein